MELKHEYVKLPGQRPEVARCLPVNSGPDPAHKEGEVIYDCPHFVDCVERVVMKHWKFWTCSECSVEMD